MKTPFTLLALSRCPWYMRTKRQSPSNIFLTILIYFLAHTCFKETRALLVEKSLDKEFTIKRHQNVHVFSDIQNHIYKKWGIKIKDDKEWDCLQDREKKIMDPFIFDFITKEYNMQAFVGWLLQKGVLLSEANMDIREMKNRLKNSHEFKRYALKEFEMDSERVLIQTENPKAVREWYWNIFETEKHRQRWANEFLESINKENILSLVLRK